jgi:hypothetical protein|tara:strand:- start:1301 stop:1759 length:459 start_codon:yes stop_codon:yes gene_type:complete
MGYTMKYTNGKKSDTSSFPFKIDAPDSTSDSPTKATVAGGAVGGMGTGAAIGAGVGSLFGGVGAVPGAIIGGGIGALAGGVSQNIQKQREYKQYKDTIDSEGLGKNFWGKMGFGGGNKMAREARINELQEQDQMGIDRERIESRGGVTAGPA